MKKKKDTVVVDVSMSNDFFYAMNNTKGYLVQQCADGSMLREDKSSVANLPTQEINKIFNANRYTERLEDAY